MRLFNFLKIWLYNSHTTGMSDASQCDRTKIHSHKCQYFIEAINILIASSHTQYTPKKPNNFKWVCWFADSVPNGQDRYESSTISVQIRIWIVLVAKWIRTVFNLFITEQSIFDASHTSVISNGAFEHITIHNDCWHNVTKPSLYQFIIRLNIHMHEVAELRAQHQAHTHTHAPSITATKMVKSHYFTLSILSPSPGQRLRASCIHCINRTKWNEMK